MQKHRLPGRKKVHLCFHTTQALTAQQQCPDNNCCYGCCPHTASSKMMAFAQFSIHLNSKCAVQMRSKCSTDTYKKDCTDLLIVKFFHIRLHTTTSTIVYFYYKASNQILFSGGSRPFLVAYQAIFRKEVQYSQNGKKLFNIKKSCSIVFLKNNFLHQKLTLILVFPKQHFPPDFRASCEGARCRWWWHTTSIVVGFRWYGPQHQTYDVMVFTSFKA